MLRRLHQNRVGFIPSTRNDKNTQDDAIEKRTRELAIGLTGTQVNQLVLVPCNVGMHWILTVIDPHKQEVGFLDPLHNGNRYGDWKQIVDVAVKMFNADLEKKGRNNMWTVIKATKQPDGPQCGFYVMKYMREIVKVEVLVTIDSLQSLFNKKKYTVEDIDEVHEEWATCVQGCIY